MKQLLKEMIISTRKILEELEKLEKQENLLKKSNEGSFETEFVKLEGNEVTPALKRIIQLWLRNKNIHNINTIYFSTDGEYMVVTIIKNDGSIKTKKEVCNHLTIEEKKAKIIINILNRME
ncbi:hypothetical protein K8R66_02440 [bacterium]|nr:hypothetical protein [bacterium]